MICTAAVGAAPSYTTPALDVNGRFVAPNNGQNTAFSSHHPIYSTADQRVKVSVATHLPTMANVLVQNEKQSSNKDIAEAFFQNQVTSEVNYNAGVFTTRLISRVYSGQCNMIKKFDSHHQWNRLMNSYGVRYLRFYLFISYREYDVATDKFKIAKYPLVIEKDQYWSANIKFVSEV